MKWFRFEMKWSEEKWVTFKFWGTKVPRTLGWPCTVGTWLYCDYFIWVCILHCGCFNLFCNMCVCFDNCVGVLVIRALLFTLFLYCFVYVYLFPFVTSVRSTAAEWNLIAVNNNNNNNNNIKFLELSKKHTSRT